MYLDQKTDGVALNRALGLLETTGLTPALAALDAMGKAAEIRVLQAELNDLLGVCIKIQGNVAAVQAAIQAGQAVAEQMGGRPIVDVIPSPQDAAWPAIVSPPEFNPLIQQDVVVFPSITVCRNGRETRSKLWTSPHPMRWA